MSIPKMIIFDYGQTLANERAFDGIAGTRAVLEHCVRGPVDVTAEEIQAFANEIDMEMGRIGPGNRHLPLTEVHNHQFQRFLYEWFQIETTMPPLELETVFWNSAAPAQPTDGIADFLRLLEERGIRTGVISNISFSGYALEQRIGRLLPGHRFEFIMASSEYIFRKPGARIFELAIKKSGLRPEEIWYCGDHLEYDIKGALACGITPVWYTGAIQKGMRAAPPGCIEIVSWGELAVRLAQPVAAGGR